MSKLPSWLPRGVDPAIPLGLLAAAIYYSVMLLTPSLKGTVLHQYTAHEPVEFVIVTFFMCGVADIVLKALTFPREKVSLSRRWLPPRVGREPIATATTLLAELKQKPEWMLESRIGKRLIAALSFLTEKGRVEDYPEHLQYLADQDDDHAHSSFGLIRFVMGASPVLGFLGTVIHFGTALSGNSLDDLADRLPTVVSQMGAAFNTTTVALASALSMMLALFLLERIDRSFLKQIDRYVERELANRFELKDPSITPFLSVLQSANDEALKTIQTTLTAQVEQWGGALQRVFELMTARQQQEQQHWQAALATVQLRQETAEVTLTERLKQTLSVVDARHEQQLDRIEQALEQALGVRDDIGVLVQSLEGLARGEGKLVDQQRVLTDNLRVLRESSQLDQALHGLTAAIHLMTARQSVAVREAA